MNRIPEEIDVAIVDYGIGNLFSVGRAFQHCGAQVTITSDREILARASGLVLPGVGAFADGMKGLLDRGLDVVVRRFAHSGKPLIGICLGMQMLATVGEEFGEHAGLDIIPGRVRRIPSCNIEGIPHKIPVVAWKDLWHPKGSQGWDGSVLEGLSLGDAVYLTHSFALEPAHAENLLAQYSYHGLNVEAAVRARNVTGVQFHPEKSGPVGMKIIKNFIESCR